MGVRAECTISPEATQIYSLPSGSNASELVIHPMKPATANGCSCTTAPGGCPGINILLPRKNSTRPPPKLLVRRISTGMTGNSPLTSPEAVIPNPLTRKKKERANPARGPAIPKSKRDLKFGGGDLSGVIAPVNPVMTEGIKLGRPMSNYPRVKQVRTRTQQVVMTKQTQRTLSFDATTRCANSWMI